MKHAIFILSDPKANSDESTARVLNALGFADECKRSGDDVEIVFAGAGTRWPQELARLDHPANERYNALRANVRGASRSCAARHGATDSLASAGVSLIADNAVPGTHGAASLRRYYADAWNVTVF